MQACPLYFTYLTILARPQLNSEEGHEWITTLEDETEVLSIFLQSYGVEVSASEREEVTEDVIRELLQKAGGANYGTGGD